MTDFPVWYNVLLDQLRMHLPNEKVELLYDEHAEFYEITARFNDSWDYTETIDRRTPICSRFAPQSGFVKMAARSFARRFGTEHKIHPEAAARFLDSEVYRQQMRQVAKELNPIMVAPMDGSPPYYLEEPKTEFSWTDFYRDEYHRLIQEKRERGAAYHLAVHNAIWKGHPKGELVYRYVLACRRAFDTEGWWSPCVVALNPNEFEKLLLHLSGINFETIIPVGGGFQLFGCEIKVTLEEEN